MRAAYEGFLASAGPAAHRTLTALSNLGRLLTVMGECPRPGPPVMLSAVALPPVGDRSSLLPATGPLLSRMLLASAVAIKTALRATDTLVRRAGKLQEAEPLLVEALRARREVLGDRHPHTARLQIQARRPRQGRDSLHPSYSASSLSCQRFLLPGNGRRPRNCSITDAAPRSCPTAGRCVKSRLPVHGPRRVDDSSGHSGIAATDLVFFSRRTHMFLISSCCGLVTSRLREARGGGATAERGPHRIKGSFGA